MDIEEIARYVVDVAVKVHRALGPGLSAQLEQQPYQTRHQTHGQQSARISREEMKKLCAFAVNMVYKGD